MTSAEDKKIKQEKFYFNLIKNSDVSGLLKLLHSEGSALCDDKGFVKLCLEKDGLEIQYASERLKEDYDLIKVALNQSSEAIRFIPKKVLNNFDFWDMLKKASIVNSLSKYISLQMIQTKEDFRRLFIFFEKDRFYFLSKVSDEILSDKGIAEKILLKNCNVLRFFPEEIRADKKLIKKIAQKNGASIYANYIHFAKSLKDDEQILYEAVKINKHLLLHASERLRQDENVMSNCVKISPELYFLLKDEQKTEKNLLTALNQSILTNFKMSISEPIPEELAKNREIVEKCLMVDGSSLKFFNNFNDDEELVLKAIKSDGGAYSYASERLKAKKGLARLALKKFSYIFRDFPESLKNDRRLVKATLKENGFLLESAPEYARKDKELVMLSLKEDPVVMGYVSDCLRSDEDVVKSVMERVSFSFFPDEIRDKMVEVHLREDNGEFSYKKSLDWYFEHKKSQDCKKEIERQVSASVNVEVVSVIKSKQEAQSKSHADGGDELSESEVGPGGAVEGQKVMKRNLRRL